MQGREWTIENEVGWEIRRSKLSHQLERAEIWFVQSLDSWLEAENINALVWEIKYVFWFKSCCYVSVIKFTKVESTRRSNFKTRVASLKSEVVWAVDRQSIRILSKRLFFERGPKLLK